MPIAPATTFDHSLPLPCVELRLMVRQQSDTNVIRGDRPEAVGVPLPG